MSLLQLAIAAAAESGNKSPRLAALLLKLAACACNEGDDVDPPLGFFGAFDSLLFDGTMYLAPGSAATPNANSEVVIVIPGQGAVGDPSGLFLRDFTVRQIGDPTNLGATILYRLTRNLVTVGTITTNDQFVGAISDASFPKVALNIGDRIGISMIMTDSTSVSIKFISASFG